MRSFIYACGYRVVTIIITENAILYSIFCIKPHHVPTNLNNFVNNDRVVINNISIQKFQIFLKFLFIFLNWVLLSWIYFNELCINILFITVRSLIKFKVALICLCWQPWIFVCIFLNLCKGKCPLLKNSRF